MLSPYRSLTSIAPTSVATIWRMSTAEWRILSNQYHQHIIPATWLLDISSGDVIYLSPLLLFRYGHCRIDLIVHHEYDEGRVLHHTISLILLVAAGFGLGLTYMNTLNTSPLWQNNDVVPSRRNAPFPTDSTTKQTSGPHAVVPSSSITFVQQSYDLHHDPTGTFTSTASTNYDSFLLISLKNTIHHHLLRLQKERHQSKPTS